VGATAPKDIARVYAARREVELLFKELKNNYRIDQLPSEKEHIVEALVYAGILTLIVSRTLLLALRKAAGIPASRSPQRRWANVFQSVARQLLSLLLRKDTAWGDWKEIEAFLLHELIDPNVNRERNLEIAWAQSLSGGDNHAIFRRRTSAKADG
jgi:hypothetical protein